MAATEIPSVHADTLHEKLQKLPKKYLVDLVKALDITFRNRTKASKERIISNILTEIEIGTRTVEDIEKELSKDKYKVPPEAKKPERLTKKVLDDFRKEMLSELEKLHSIENSLSNVEESIRGLGHKISQQSERLASLESLVSISNEKLSLQNLLKIMRKLNLNLQTPQDFDKGIQELLRSNVKLSEFIKMSNVIITMSKLNDLVRSITWPEDLDLFYNTLKAEFEKAVSETGQPVPIYRMKQIVSKRLAISDKDFEKQLISCFKKGWLTLDLRSPIGEEQTEFLEVDGRKYYVIRSLQRE